MAYRKRTLKASLIFLILIVTEKILKLWSKRWNPSENQKVYEETFATTRWKDLPLEEKHTHTLTKCEGCYKKFGAIQHLFPKGPYYDYNPIVSVDTDQLQFLGKKQATRKALKEMNAAFSETYRTTFTNSLVRYDSGVQKQPTAGERKKKLRTIYRQCRDKENEALKKSAAISVLTEDESMRSYERKRKCQYFEPTPPAKRSRSKSHSPNFGNVTWDKEKVLRDLQSLPSAPPAMNWQTFAREHGITGSNAGQVAKEFSQISGMDTTRLDGRDTSTQRSCARRRRLIGEISVGSTPISSEIKHEWINVVETGEISLGQPCVPYNITWYDLQPRMVSYTKHKLVLLVGNFPFWKLERSSLLSRRNTCAWQRILRYKACLQMTLAYSLTKSITKAKQYHCLNCKMKPQAYNALDPLSCGTIMAQFCA